MRLKLLAIVALLAVGGFAIVMTLGGLPRSNASSVTYLTATASVADVSNDVAATGSVASSTSWTLAFGAAASRSDGSAASSSSSSDASASASSQGTGTWTVRTVAAKVGDVVKRGDVLATAVNPELTASIVAAKNDWTAARLQLLQAQDAYDAATTTATQRQTRASLLNATNAVATARANLDDLKVTAARNRLVAPAAGIVTAVDVSVGADAPSGAAITLDSTDYAVTADVVESDVAAMKVGQAARVTVAAIGADLDGTVTAVAPTASSSSSTSSVVSYAVTVSLAQPPATLRSGMTADITITTASASGVLAVPAAAIRGTAGSYTVLVMAAGGSPEARPVTVGLMTSDLVEVRSGLSAGDVVVTGTSSAQRTTTGTGLGGGNGTFTVPGGGGGFRGPGN